MLRKNEGQQTPGNTVASRRWNDLTFYVVNVPGDGGVDWGYTTERSKALRLNTYYARRFVADCRRVGAVATVSEA